MNERNEDGKSYKPICVIVFGKYENMLVGSQSKLKGRMNHLIQEFDKDVQGKRIPSWIFNHFGLARLVVLGRNEVLELLKFHLPKCSNAE